MKQIRFRATALACWLILFYSIERLVDPVVITNAAYMVVLLVALLTLLAPRWSRGPLWAILAIPIFLLLVFKVWTGSRVLGSATVLTIAEAGAVIVTILLARWVSSALNEFEDVIAHITLGQRGQAAEPSSAGQGLIYREVRRARNYERPLTLMAIAVEEESIRVALNRMVQEAQSAMMKQYALAGVSKALCDELGDCDVVVQGNDHFLVVLPEITPEQLPGLIERLHRLVADQVGVTLRFGTASLPQDALTFEGLMDKAIKEMKGDLARQPSTRPACPSVKPHTA